MKPGFLFRGRSRIRPSRAIALPSTLTLLAQAILVGVGSMALGGCTTACTPSTGTGGYTPADAAPADGGAVAAGSATTAGDASFSLPARRAGLAPRPGSKIPSVLMLPTGEQIRLARTPDAGVTMTPLPLPARSGVPGGFVRASVNGGYYMIPYEAVPYLGSLLDPRLFDVSYLATAASGGVRLQISYQGASAPSLPGVRISQAAGGIAEGTLIPAHAAQFGALLASRWRAGQPWLPGITRISLAATPGTPVPAGLPVSPPRRVSGGLPYHTLTLKFVGLNGKPAAAAGLVQNVSDARLGTQLVAPFVTQQLTLRGSRGPLNLSVPDGTYSLAFSIMTPQPGSVSGVDAAMVIDPQVSIGSNQTITLDARNTVPYRAQVSPPVSASVQIQQTDLWRGSVLGGSCGGETASDELGLVSVSGDGYTASPFRVSPTRKVTEGTFYFEANTSFVPYPQTVSKAASNYYLDFPDSGDVPASLSYQVPRQDLTAVHERIDTAPPGASGGSRTPTGVQEATVFPLIYHPWGDYDQLGGSGAFDAVGIGNRTDYWYSSEPSLTRWQNVVLSYGYCTGSCVSAAVPASTGPVVAIQPGEQLSQTYGKWPLVPSPLPPYADPLVAYGEGLPAIYAENATVVAASRQNNNGVLDLQFNDSSPGNASAPAAGYATVTLYRDGKAVIPAGEYPPDQSGPDNYYLPLSGQPATYTLDWTQYPQLHPGPGEVPGEVTTDWTFRSGPDDPTAALPKNELCPVDPTRACSALPLLFIGYDLPLDVHSQVPAGQPVKIAFTVGCQPHAPAATGLSATVSASFNDGKTWTTPRSASSLGHGRFALTLSQPPLSGTDGFVSLRVTAHDVAGGSVTQTLIRAYGLSG